MAYIFMVVSAWGSSWSSHSGWGLHGLNFPLAPNWGRNLGFLISLLDLEQKWRGECLGLKSIRHQKKKNAVRLIIIISQLSFLLFYFLSQANPIYSTHNKLSTRTKYIIIQIISQYLWKDRLSIHVTTNSQLDHIIRPWFPLLSS